MEIKKTLLAAIGICTLAQIPCLLADSGGGVPYPSGYRTWAVTRSFVAGPESKNAGFHHYYANAKALQGFDTGRFPDGAVIVDERLEVERTAEGSFEGKRISIAVMMKDSRQYAATGGWGFDAAAGDSQTLGAAPDKRAVCYSCHSNRKDHDFVFSALRK